MAIYLYGTREPYVMPDEFLLEKINRLVAAMSETPISFEAWQDDRKGQANEAAPIQCSCSYKTDLELPDVRCPNPVTQYVRIYKDSEVLSPMCDDCAEQSWNIGD